LSGGCEQRAPLPIARSEPSCAYLGGMIVVFGGEATGKCSAPTSFTIPRSKVGNPARRWPFLRHGLHGSTCARDRQHDAHCGRRPGAGRAGAGRLPRAFMFGWQVSEQKKKKQPKRTLQNIQPYG
jgi:hypothetical protein